MYSTRHAHPEYHEVAQGQGTPPASRTCAFLSNLGKLNECMALYSRAAKSCREGPIPFFPLYNISLCLFESS
jgi:hypothetical protein